MIKSITIDFEHEIIWVRPSDRDEYRISKNEIAKQIYAVAIKDQINAKDIDDIISKKRNAILESSNSEDKKNDMLSGLDNQEVIDRIRRSVQVEKAKDKSIDQAKKKMDNLLSGLSKAIEKAGI